ncbi:MAG TPA: hypothetical protein PK076_06030 [Saprospiraceae bacterium]|nr:hypothetical protein [Saprospiraceae bacterium]HQW55664.1 hypothetical protein [Saprospiraceae bacterium]
MKSKYLMIALIAIIIFGCKTPRILPTSGNIDVNEYGSYIKTKLVSKSKIEGELIAIDSTSMVILSKADGNCKIIPIANVHSFKLLYAKPKKYYWAYPVFLLLSATHQFIGAISLPVNFIATTLIIISANNAFTYTNKKIKYEELKMFARFPEGIPASIKIENIR